ncbi:hypothetical protein CIB93_04460 [Streptomyces sp. WZ.A104]|uniref:hypothetical protein n=1 Tax=Streptomyces sp. WZ.A104 TaxID=2023771 RepID=UPI000BBC7DAB|nr:hypothetical protein [Streptomyces sp. WZ.A104]PCG87105.1 hypothetical protein CIB93_04460 [Streptomyces sp. WZ.A104]
MLDLTALSETVESLGNRALAQELTVLDMFVLVEVAVIPEPARRREAARHALTAARRASWDSTDPEWVTPRTWASAQRRTPSAGRARRVLDCDGCAWERRHVVEDGDVFEVDVWSPVSQRRGVPHLVVHEWGELLHHYGPLTEISSHLWPQQPPWSSGSS